MPKPLQTARFIVRPVSFLEAARSRYGETFSASLFGPGELTMLSDPPSIKKLFAADRVNTIAPGRNIVLGPILGSGSLLLQQDEEHMRRRRLMLPSFHGDRMRAYAETVAEATERAIASWPSDREFPLHPSMQEITLEVILRAVFGIEDSDRRRELSAGLVAVLTESGRPGRLRADGARGAGSAPLSPLPPQAGRDRRAAGAGDSRAAAPTPSSPSARTSSR